MTLSTWIRRCFVRQSASRAPMVRRRKPKVRPAIRPVLEILENRLAPAVLTVNTLADGATDTTHLDLREALTLANNNGNPTALNQTSMPAGWASQINGAFGSSNTIQFDPSLLTQNVGFGLGVIGLTSMGDGTAGPSALGVDNDVQIIGPSTGPGITIESPSTAPGINVPNMRLFYVAPNTQLTLDNLTLQGGNALGGNGGGSGGGGAGLGGAIFNQGDLNIHNSLLTGNAARGGASYSPGTNYLGGGGGGMGGNGGRYIGGGPNGGGFIRTGVNVYNGGFGGGGSSGGGVSVGNGGFGGGGGGGLVHTVNAEDVAYGGNGGFGGGGGGGLVNIEGNGSAGVSEFGGGEGSTATSGTVSDGADAGGGGAGFGGAIFNDQTSARAPAIVTITDTTITGNLAAAGPSPIHDGMGAGAGIFNYNGNVTVNYSTLVGNYAAQGGAEFYNLGDGVGNLAGLTLNDSILADSQGSSEDLHSAAINSGGQLVQGINNLIMSAAGAPTTSPFLISNANPNLGPLQNNGGPTRTMAPLRGSPVLDQGVNSAALGVTTDARGLPRIYDLSSTSNAANGDG